MTNPNNHLTDAEREFIDKATSNKYAEYLVETKIIERLPHLFKRYRIILILILAAITGFGIFQISQFISISKKNESLSKLEKNVTVLMDSLKFKNMYIDQLIAKLNTTNDELNTIVTNHSDLRISHEQIITERKDNIKALEDIVIVQKEITEEKRKVFEAQIEQNNILIKQLEDRIAQLEGNELIDAAKKITNYLSSSLSVTLLDNSRINLKPPGLESEIPLKIDEIDNREVQLSFNDANLETIRKGNSIEKMIGTNKFKITIDDIYEIKINRYKSYRLAVITIDYNFQGL